MKLRHGVSMPQNSVSFTCFSLNAASIFIAVFRQSFVKPRLSIRRIFNPIRHEYSALADIFCWEDLYGLANANGLFLVIFAT